MRRLLLLFLFFSFTSLACGQSVSEVHLKNGSVIKGSILEMDPSNGVKVQTNDGSIFVYSMSDVEVIKKSEETTSNRYASSTGSVRKINRHKGNFYWEDNNRELTDDEYTTVLDDNLYITFREAHKQFNTGRTLMIIGLASTGIAVLSYLAYLDSYVEGEYISYYSEPGYKDLYTLSVVIADAGLCLGCIFKGIGKGRLEWVKDTYNSGRSYSSTINFAPSLMMTAQKDLGFGVSMNFTF